MWVQYKQGQAITPQQKTSTQTQSLRYCTLDAPSSSEQQKAQPSEAQAAVKNSANSTVFLERFKKSKVGKQNDFTEKTLAEPKISGKAMLFSDELESMTSPHIAQSHRHAQHQAYYHNEKARHYSRTKNNRALLGFALFYLFGAVLSGILYASLSNTQAQYLTYCTSNFIENMATASVIACCINRCGICAIGLTIVLLLGLSALGFPLLLIFLFLKGIGSGVLLLQFFTQYQWHGLLYYFASIGIADACLATGLCLLSCTAAKHASALFQLAFSPQITSDCTKIRQLARQYLVLLFVLLLVCLLNIVTFHALFGNFQL